MTDAPAEGAGGCSLAAEMNAYLARTVPRIGGLGIEVVDATAERIVARAPLATNLNHLGSMYAGTLFGMGEMMGATMMYASFDFAAYLPTVKEMTIRYRRPARTDITGTATLDGVTLDRIRREAGEHGRAEYQADAVLTDAGGTVVATTRGTYQLLAMALVTGRHG